MRKLYISNFLNPCSDKKCDFLMHGAMVIKQNKAGVFKIEYLGSINQAFRTFNQFDEVYDYRHALIGPGFYDMHFHWVQDDVREMPKDSLLQWLDNYTFPAEAKFKDKSYAKKKAKSFFKKLLKNGTLGGACYSSIHGHAVDYAFENCVGDFIIGNVLMTMNSPKSLTQSSKQAINLTKKLSEKYKERYAVTPRFAIATDPKTMQETALLGKKNKSFIQTHLSENHDEISFVESLYKKMKGFESISSYTDIYKKVGLLGKRTIMGHAIHLKQDELDLLKKSHTAIAHCPTSNASHKELGLQSGLFNFKKIEKNKIRWALASDIGGGPYLSMLDVMNSFVQQNKKAKVSGATYTKAYYRATLAGAKILGVENKKGNLALGKEANFVVMKLPFKIQKEDKAEDILSKLIYPLRNKRKQYQDMVNEVYYQGHRVDE